MAKKALTAPQESRLIRYLDGELLRLSGALEARHAPTARLPTLDAFLDAVHPLLAFILAIPAAPPSHALRVAYLLQLTGYLAPAIDGYVLADACLPALFDTFARFDAGWVAVLEGADWDSARGEPEPAPAPAEGAPTGGAMRTTDRVRLDSLVREIKGVLAVSLGLPEFVPLENDPFEQLLRQRELESARLGELRRPQEEGDDGDEEMQPAGSGAATPSLVSDASTAGDTDDAMSVDTAVATPSELLDGTADDEDEDDEDGVDFEEVVLPAPHGPISLSSTAASSSSFLADGGAYAEPPAADGSFNVHFTGVPPPTLQDGELSLQGGQTPFVAQQRGFDPDAEYPLAEEDGDPIGGNALTGPGGEDAPEVEDGIDEGTRERVKRVFERTEKVLAELKAQAQAQAAAAA
ncbi:hypothetical protein JCM10450v2_001983 [Rhodotorula kratochvilovae]